MVRLVGHPRANSAIRQVGHAVMRDDPEQGREVGSGLPFGLAAVDMPDGGFGAHDAAFLSS